MKDEHEQLLRIARASWGAIVGPATESEQGCFDQGFRAAVFALEASLSHAAGQEVDDSLPRPLWPVSEEWYRLCERRFYVDRITISGKLAEAIVDAICAPAVARSEGEV